MIMIFFLKAIIKILYKHNARPPAVGLKAVRGLLHLTLLHALLLVQTHVIFMQSCRLFWQ